MIVAFLNPQSTLVNSAPTSDFDRQAGGLATLLQHAELIPVTGLDEEGLLTVPAAFTSWQILLHGAVVLTPDGTEDEAWRRLSLEAQRGAEPALELAYQAAQHVNELGQLGLQADLLARGGAPLLVRLTHPHGLALATAQAAATLRDWLRDGPFQGVLRLEYTSDSVTILPSQLRPEGAVNYVLGQLEDVKLTLGVSAQPGDYPFLALCDYALMPGNTTLLEQTAQDPDET